MTTHAQTSGSKCHVTRVTCSSWRRLRTVERSSLWLDCVGCRSRLRVQSTFTSCWTAHVQATSTAHWLSTQTRSATLAATRSFSSSNIAVCPVSSDTVFAIQICRWFPLAATNNCCVTQYKNTFISVVHDPWRIWRLFFWGLRPQTLNGRALGPRWGLPSLRRFCFPLSNFLHRPLRPEYSKARGLRLSPFWKWRNNGKRKNVYKWIAKREFAMHNIEHIRASFCTFSNASWLLWAAG